MVKKDRQLIPQGIENFEKSRVSLLSREKKDRWYEIKKLLGEPHGLQGEHELIIEWQKLSKEAHDLFHNPDKAFGDES